MKIISLSPGITDLLNLLGISLSGVSNYCICNAPTVGSILAVNKKLVEKIDPDIILTSTAIQKGLSEELSDKYSVIHFECKTLSDIFYMFREVGRLVDKDVAWLISKFQKELSFEYKKSARLVVEEWDNPIMIAGNWLPKLAEKCGYIYPVKEGELSRAFSIEELEEFNPDVVVRSLCGKSKLPLLDWNVCAVENNRVISITDYVLNTPGPRLLTGIKILKFYHPYQTQN